LCDVVTNNIITVSTRKVSKLFKKILFYTKELDKMISVLNFTLRIKEHSLDKHLTKLHEYNKAFFVGFARTLGAVDNIDVQTQTQEMMDRLVCFVKIFGVAFIRKYMNIDTITIEEFIDMKYNEKIEYFNTVHKKYSQFIHFLSSAQDRINIYHNKTNKMIHNILKIDTLEDITINVTEKNGLNDSIELYLNDKLNIDELLSIYEKIDQNNI